MNYLKNCWYGGIVVIIYLIVGLVRIIYCYGNFLLFYLVYEFLIII